MIDSEIDFYVSEGGYSLDQARTFALLRRMWEGDLGALRHAIMSGWPLDDAVMLMLADMISDDPVSHPFQARYQIATRQRHRQGRRRDADRVGRRYRVGKLYDEYPEGGSDAAFEGIAKVLGMSHQAVRADYTAYHKGRKGRSAK